MSVEHLTSGAVNERRVMPGKSEKERERQTHVSLFNWVWKSIEVHRREWKVHMKCRIV